MAADFSIEAPLWNAGKQHIVGLDEVGRGPWAGPVVAAAVIFPTYITLPQALDDSKKLTEKKRRLLKEIIEENAVTIGIGESSAEDIDANGIVYATQKAMANALQNIQVEPDHYLIDAFKLQHIQPEKQNAIVKGDAISATIAAASIIAKIYRDELMKELSTNPQYSAYGFEKHKGYGTKIHKEAILEHGLTNQHRRTFIHFV